MLKSRTTWPPTGWRFREAATGKLVTGQSFGSLVDAVIRHRLSNPRFNLSTDYNTVESEVDEYICAVLKHDHHWCSEVPNANFRLPPPEQRRPVEAKGSAAGVSKFLANTTAGIKVWLEWFGDGKLVDRADAERRANICKDCPQNEKANIAQKFSAAAAKEMLSILGALHDLELRTPQDDSLEICKACECPLKAKVWTPIKIIKKHTRDDVFTKLDPRCWMLHEKA